MSKQEKIDTLFEVESHTNKILTDGKSVEVELYNKRNCCRFIFHGNKDIILHEKLTLSDAIQLINSFYQGVLASRAYGINKGDLK